MIQSIRDIIIQYQDLERELAQPEVVSDLTRLEKTTRKYRAIAKNMPTYLEFIRIMHGLDQAREMLGAETDPEMIHLTKDEITSLEAELPAIEEKIKLLLAPRDPDDNKNAILEIRAGTGGIEAGIFGANLYRMYIHYIESRGWSYEVMEASYGDLDSVKEVVILITGDGVYGTLKFESGVHRVQRVPETESQGRIHTSAATVVVLPEASEVDAQINPQDLRVDVYRAGGAGGQHVNKTESAVRMVHIPTGLTVICQDEKSQIKNRAKAMKVLQSRLYDRMISEQHSEEAKVRKSMVSTGDRSAKIRTYNFPQNRVTDHRINFTMYSLDKFIDGDIQQLLAALEVADLNERLKSAALT